MSPLEVAIRRKAYGRRAILRDIAFVVDPGETFAILGSSGAGKSTLLRIVADLDSDLGGWVCRLGVVVMVFQEPTLLPWRSAIENITLVTGVAPADAQAALDEVGLKDMAAERPRQVSLGQRQHLGDERLIAAARPVTLFVTHAPVEAERLAGRVLRLEATAPREAASP